jgi:serine/threonine-protein kinase TTK/MPS1
MATASPTPAPTGAVRRASQRQALRRPNSRQALNRHESEPPAPASRAAKDAQQQYHDDSSEDEIPVPMKLSALTKALLNDGSSDAADRQPHNSLPRTRQRNSGLNSSTSSATEGRRHLRSGSVQAADAKGSRPPTPEKQLDSSPPRKRVVRLSSNGPQSLSQMGPSSRRSTSTSGSAPRSGQRTTQPARPTSRNSGREKPEGDSQLEDVNTPAQNGRVVRIVTGSSGNRNRIGSLGPSSGRSTTDRSAADRSFVDRSVVDRSAVDRTGLGADEGDYEDPDMVARNAPPVSVGSIGRYPSTASKSRTDEHGNPQSSMRVKRVGKLPGSFLSGPARRGRRRQSEEEGEENGYAEGFVSSQEPESLPAVDPVAAPLHTEGGLHDFNSGSPVSGSAAARAIHRRQASNAELRTSARPSPRPQAQAPVEVKAEEELPAVRGDLPSTHDQENEPPASYKRAKPSVVPAAERVPNRPLSVDLEHVKTSPERKPLASIASNTPHRAAPPPPPKMSVLDAATTNAGAATSGQAKQRRNVLKVNGKCYTRLDCVGRGGSAKVYRVSAENGMMYALKRVSLENADESTIKGFRGEIDLLQKLSGVERVINLLDHEMNNEKQVLTLVRRSPLSIH